MNRQLKIKSPASDVTGCILERSENFRNEIERKFEEKLTQHPNKWSRALSARFKSMLDFVFRESECDSARIFEDN